MLHTVHVHALNHYGHSEAYSSVLHVLLHCHTCTITYMDMCTTVHVFYTCTMYMYVLYLNVIKFIL